MKNLNNYIVEKLKLTTSLLKNNTDDYNIELFVKMVSDQLNNNDITKSLVIDLLNEYLDIQGANAIKLVDVSNNKSEMSNFLGILDRVSDTAFESAYCIIPNNDKGKFFHYYNIHIKDGSDAEQYRIGYILTNKSSEREDWEINIFKLQNV